MKALKYPRLQRVLLPAGCRAARACMRGSARHGRASPCPSRTRAPRARPSGTTAASVPNGSTPSPPACAPRCSPRTTSRRATPSSSSTPPSRRARCDSVQIQPSLHASCQGPCASQGRRQYDCHCVEALDCRREAIYRMDRCLCMDHWQTINLQLSRKANAGCPDLGRPSKSYFYVTVGIGAFDSTVPTLLETLALRGKGQA